jgi:hypothetical protein
VILASQKALFLGKKTRENLIPSSSPLQRGGVFPYPSVDFSGMGERPVFHKFLLSFLSDLARAVDLVAPANNVEK